MSTAEIEQDRTMSSENANENPPAPPGSYKTALDLLRPELMAMPSDRIMRGVSLDASVAAQIAEAGAAKLLPHRDALIAEYGERASVLVDGLTTTAHATKQTDIELARTKTSDDLTPMQAEAAKHYELLMTDARGLVNRGFLDPKSLDPAQTVLGYQALLQSVLVLVSLFRELWPVLQHHTHLKLTHLDAAELAAQQMTTTIALRDYGVHRIAATDLRNRALTKLIRDYDAIRRMVTYVRWEEKDVDDLVPSFWAAARGRKRRAKPQRVASSTHGGPAPTHTTEDVQPSRQPLASRDRAE
jgi:hypothetical protein